MDQIELSSEEVPTTHPLKSRGLIVTVVAALAAGGLIVASFLLFLQYFGPPASLQVTTTRVGAQVFVNGTLVGKTNWRGDYRPGEYTVKIEDIEYGAKTWQGKIQLHAATLTSVDWDLGPSDDFSGGVVLSLPRGSDLVVSSTPVGAKVTLDDNDIGTTPLKRPLPSPGTHSIKLVLSGYLTKEISINVSPGWELAATVTLFKDPEVAVTQVEEQPIKPSPSSQLDIVTRQTLGLDKITGDISSNGYANWTTVRLFSLLTTNQSWSTDLKTWVQGLAYYADYRLLLTDIPWHYLIDPTGKIYEGRGGGYWSTSLDPTLGLAAAAHQPILKPGVAVVAYLGPTGQIPVAVTDSFHKLVAWLGQPPKLAATPEVVTTMNMTASQQQEVTLSFHNSGLATWFNFGDNRTTVTTAGHTSDFVTNGNWLDTSHPAVASQTYVSREQVGTYKFTLTAPKYGGDYTETYNLVQSGRTAEGSLVSIKIHVDGPVKPVAQVKIADTGSGFLRIRGGPGLNYSEVGRATIGASYEWLEDGSGWYKIKFGDNQTGWVSSQFTIKL